MYLPPATYNTTVSSADVYGSGQYLACAEITGKITFFLITSCTISGCTPYSTTNCLQCTQPSLFIYTYSSGLTNYYIHAFVNGLVMQI
jgi:hypothetical protein